MNADNWMDLKTEDAEKNTVIFKHFNFKVFLHSPFTLITMLNGSKLYGLKYLLNGLNWQRFIY